MERGFFGFGVLKGMIRRFVLLALSLFTSSLLCAADRTPDEIKSSAYQLYAAKQIEKAIAEFRAYLAQRPEDIPANLDFAGVLSEAKQHAEAARILEQIRQHQPTHESAYFKLAVEYVYLDRTGDAAKIFSELEKSLNRDLAEAAADAARRLQGNVTREARLKAEQ